MFNDLLLQASAIPVTDYISNFGDLATHTSLLAQGTVDLDVQTVDPGINFRLGSGFAQIIRWIGVLGTMFWVVFALWKLSLPSNQGNSITQRLGGWTSILGGLLAITAALLPNVLAKLLELCIKIGATIIQVLTGALGG